MGCLLAAVVAGVRVIGAIYALYRLFYCSPICHLSRVSSPQEDRVGALVAHVYVFLG